MLYGLLIYFFGVMGIVCYVFGQARARIVIALLIALFCLSCFGCATYPHVNLPDEHHIAMKLAAAFMAFIAIMWFFVNGSRWRDVIWYFGAIGLLVLVLLLGGCAALPMPLQPVNQQYNSNMAEGGFLVLETVDTLQTMHIRKGTSCDHEADPIAAFIYGSKYPKPGRVLVTNLALMTVHTMVTSWLDDEVATHDQANDGSVGPWYVGRVAWHAVSLVAAGSSVISNHSRGCAL